MSKAETYLGQISAMEDGQDAVKADGLIEQGDETDDGDAQLDVEEPQEGGD